MFRLTPNRTSSTNQPTDWRIFSRAFTLTELMVVIAIMSILVATLVPVLASTFRQAKSNVELQAARQLIRGYNTASEDNKGKLLVGYLSDDPDEDDYMGDEIIIGPDGTPIQGIELQRWTWRLLPYLDSNVDALFVGQGRDYIDGIRGSENFAYIASVYPSFGLNAEWMGGMKSGTYADLHTLGTFTGETYYAQRRSEVRRPGQQLVFTSAAGPMESGSSSVEGYFYTRSPWYLTTGWRWNTDEEGRPSLSYEQGDPAASGYVSARHDGRVVTAMLDGHTALEPLADLADMRRWSNDATSADWVIDPQLP
jgi:prepilin-type N-terminal cleavage/methylation domain-containing protein/prepilin-type processing-associated H-X9-DG protein